MSPSQLIHHYNSESGRRLHHYGLMEWKQEAEEAARAHNNPPLKARLNVGGTCLDQHGNNDNANNMECSMCGDLGLSGSLFRCSKCGFRYQHTYCSNWYPRERSIYVEICNWCASESAAGMPSKNTAITGCSSAATARHEVGTNGHVKSCDLIEEEDDDDEDGPDPGMMCATQMMRRHHHVHHHSPSSDASHANRLIKKASKRLVVRRYKFVSEV